MKRNKLLSFATRCVSATLLFFFLLSAEGYTQQVDFCGEFHKTNNPVPTDSIYYMDRFGNYYTAAELMVQNGNQNNNGQITVNHCPGNLFFQLNFVPLSDFTNDEIESITCAFVEISQNLNPPVLANLPRIRITKSDSLPVGAAAVGSPLWTQIANHCSLSESNVWKKLHTITTGTVYDAIIKIERNSSWSHFPNLDPNQLDLFTVALHEGLHGLGFASQLDTIIPNNNSNFSTPYSTWDRLLFNRNTSRFLIRKKPINTSCACPNYGLPNSFDYGSILQGCNQVDLRLGCNANIAVNTTFVSSNPNSISHLCDPATVMFPSLSTNERKRIDAQTREALCLLGYQVTNITCPPRMFLLPPVDVSFNLGTNDTGMFDADTIFSLNNLAKGSAKLTLFPIGLIPTKKVGSTNMYQFSVNPKANTCGQFIVKYSLSRNEFCNNTDSIENCAEGRLFIFKSCKDLPTSNPLICNLVLKGSIDSISSDVWTTNKGAISAYTNFDLLNIPYQNKSTGSNVQLVTNSPTDKFIRFVYPNTNEGRVPAMYFRLKKTLVGGKQYRISYRKRAVNNGTLNFAFCTSPPCTPMATMGFLLNQPIAATDCTPFPRHIVTHNFTASPNPAVWDNAPIPAITNPITLPTGLNANYLIVYGNRGTTFPIPAGQNTEIFLDDIEVIALEDAQISIEAPNPAVVACKGGNATINFKVTNTANTAVTGTFTLIPRVPAGMTLISPASTGILVTLGQGGTPKGSQIIPIIVSVGNVTAPFDVSFDFVRVIKPTDNACLASNQRARVTVQAATPANAAFTINNTLNCQNLVLSMSASSTTGLKRWSIREVDFNNVAIGTYTHFSTASNPTFDFNVAPFNAVNKRYQIVLRDSLISGPCTTLDITTQFVYRPDCTPALCPCTTAASHNIRATAANGEILYSNTTLKNNRGLSNCATVTGTLVLDESTTFTGMTFMMQPGSRIRVLSNTPGRLDINNGCVFKSCLQRWQGIDIEPNTNFNSWNSTYEDAEVALKFNSSNGNSVAGLIQGNTFNKNYICIEAKGLQITSTTPSWNIRLYQNTFDCTADLLPPSPGAIYVNNTGTRGLVGIFCKYASLDIGQINVSTNRNTFRNIRNGIFSLVSLVNSYNSDINNLVLDNTHTNAVFVEPYLPNPSSQNAISQTGVVSWGSFVRVYDNSITGVRKGIHNESCLNFDMRRSNVNSIIAGVYNTNTNGGINILGNVFPSSVTAGAYGYRIFDSPNATVTYHNTFFSTNLVNSLNTPGYFFRIQASNSGSVGTKRLFNVRSNLAATFVGLSIEGDGRYQVTESGFNYIDNTSSTNCVGVGLSMSNNNVLVGNQVTATGITLASGNGFKIHESINNTLCCNYTKDFPIEVYFDGTCSGTKLKNHLFGGGTTANNRLGLLLNYSTEIGQQGVSSSLSFNNGFNFLSPATSFIGLPAKHLSAFNPLEVSYVNNSKFWVKTDAVELPSGIQDNGLFWFKDNVSGTHSPYVCNSLASTCSVSLTPMRQSSNDRNVIPVPENIVAYAEGLPNGVYGNFLQHEGSKWALAELEKNPQYLGSNPIVDRFYVNTFNSNIRRFNDIEQLIAKFNAPTSQETTQRENIYTTIDNLNTQINSLDIAYTNLTESEKVINTQQRGNLTQQRFSKFQDLVAIQDVIKNRTQSYIEEAENINYYLNTGDNYEATEKKINAIYFNTLARGIIQFSEADKAIINATAPLCPKIAGKGVFRARYLQSIYQNTTYTDVENCIVNNPPNGAGVASKMSKDNDTFINPKDFKVFPNPTRDILFIEAPSSLVFDVVIRDLTGHILRQENNTNNTQINVSDFINGIYICEFWYANQCKNQQKVIIIH